MKAFKSVLLILSLLIIVGAGASSMVTSSGRLTMLVVPARYSVLQVMFDVLERRSAVLVSYQGDSSSGEPLLHAWNGSEWVYVSLEDYETARFAQNTPTQAVLIGDENTLPSVLVEKSSWCPLVMSVPAVDTATLVNSLGKVFNFRRSDWSWFSKRYNLDLQDLNADRRKACWYDEPYVDPGTEFPLFKRNSAGAYEAQSPETSDASPSPETVEITEGTVIPDASAVEPAGDQELPPAKVVIPTAGEQGAEPAGEEPAAEYDSSIK